MGYGITKDLKNITLGSEEDINHYFETGKFHNQINDKQKEVLKEILHYRKEQGIGQTRTTGVERGSNRRTSRSNKGATRSLASRKRLPLRPPRAKSKSLSGR